MFPHPFRRGNLMLGLSSELQVRASMRPHPFRRGNSQSRTQNIRADRSFNEAPPIQAGKLADTRDHRRPGHTGFNEAPPIQAGKPGTSGRLTRTSTSFNEAPPIQAGKPGDPRAEGLPVVWLQ